MQLCRSRRVSDEKEPEPDVREDGEDSADPPPLRLVPEEKHEGKAGLYAAVLTEGMVRKGDRVELLD